jgi:hypothetical protein
MYEGTTRYSKMNHNTTTVIINNTTIILIIIALSSLSGMIVLAAGATTRFVANNIAFAQSIPVVNNTLLLPSNASATTVSLPSASSIYQTETMKVPATVKTIVIYAANELHEDIKNEKHRLISDRNPYFVPKNTIVSNGTSLVIHNADAPWDIPHPHTFVVGRQNSNSRLDYATNTQEFRLAPGSYNITATDSPWAVGSVEVLSSSDAVARRPTSLIVGTFYTPTTQVSNPKDNEGGIHPGNLAYYIQEFPRNGLKIESTYNFTYASCSFCPGKFWPDNKSGNHTLIVWSSSQPLSNVLAVLTKLTKENVYI